MKIGKIKDKTHPKIQFIDIILYTKDLSYGGNQL